jgi:hypothetical protein
VCVFVTVIGGSGEVRASASKKGSTEKIEQNPIWRYHPPARRHVFDTVLKHGWLSAPCLAATWRKKNYNHSNRYGRRTTTTMTTTTTTTHFKSFQSRIELLSNNVYSLLFQEVYWFLHPGAEADWQRALLVSTHYLTIPPVLLKAGSKEVTVC